MAEIPGTSGHVGDVAGSPTASPKRPSLRLFEPLEKLTMVPKLPTFIQNNLNEQRIHAKKVLVGNLPRNIGEEEIKEFFNDSLSSILEENSEANFVENVEINADCYATMDMTSICYANVALELNGILFKGLPLLVTRTNMYDPVFAATLGLPFESDATLSLKNVKRLVCYVLQDLRNDNLEDVKKIVKSLIGVAPRSVCRLPQDDKQVILFFENDSCSKKQIEFLSDVLDTTFCLSPHGLLQASYQGTYNSIEREILIRPEGFVTRIVFVTNIASEEADMNYKVVIKDVIEEGSKHGIVLRYLVSTPEKDHICETTKVFLEYKLSEHAMRAVQAFSSWEYHQRKVTSGFYSEIALQETMLSLQI